MASASRDTPRRALELLDAVSDDAVVSGVARADRALVARALERLGVDPQGSTALDRAYLGALEDAGHPLSVRTLAARVSATVQALEEVTEPFLLRRGWIEIGPGGRALSGRRERAG